MYKIAILDNTENFQYNVDLNKSYPLETAIELVKDFRENNVKSELYPEEYAIPLIREESAWNIALEEYEKSRSKSPENYGELQKVADKPICYVFYCRDYEKEREGMIPGLLTIRVDKITGKLLNSSDLKEYNKLNYSF